MEYIINGIRGFCMALADSVPGVSGGTIAFILGFYDKFINSLDRLMFGNKEEKKEAIKFLIKIGIGWGIGLILAVLALANLFQTQIYKVSSIFLGFIIFSIPLIIKEEKKVLKGRYINLIFTVMGMAVVALITYFNPVSGDGNMVNLTNLNFGLIAYVFVAGMIAISAMVLPGISGSTLLLIFGLYIPIISAIKEFLHFNLSYFPILLAFGIGIITGVLVVIKLIKIALNKYRSQTIYCIIGLMIGSLYSIVMGPTTLETSCEPITLETFNIIFFIIGGLIIIALGKIKTIFEKKN